MRRKALLPVLAVTAMLWLGNCAAQPGVTDTAMPATSPAQTPASTPTLAPVTVAPLPTPIPGMASARVLLHSDEDLNIAIFGDSTGDELTEWPALWADELSSDHSVALNRWIRSAESYQSSALSESGPGRDIWNCSVSGWKPVNFYDYVDDCLPVAPDIVIISLGHNNTSQPDQVIPQLEILLGMIRYEAASSDVPIVITLQNPVVTADRQPGETEVLEELKSWTESEGYPVIDVYTAFLESDEGTNALLKDDGLHPSELGSQVWLKAVVATLTPWRVPA